MDDPQNLNNIMLEQYLAAWKKHNAMQSDALGKSRMKIRWISYVGLPVCGQQGFQGWIQGQ
jgi:hypothetical protein